MASLVRPWKTYYVDAQGKCVPQPKGTPGAQKVKERYRDWYAQGVPGWPKHKRVELASDKEAARQMLAELIRKAERGQAGLTDPYAAHRLRPVTEHVDDYLAFLRSKGNTENHITLTGQRIRSILEGCGFTSTADLKGATIADYLATRRAKPKAEGGLSVASSNYYLTAVKGFCRWLVRDGRMSENPIAYLQGNKGNNARLDRRHDRRNLSAEEMGRLVNVARASTKVYKKLTGEDRYHLYLTACATKVRVSELAELKPESFALDGEIPTVTVAAAYTKNRQPVTQPDLRRCHRGSAALPGNPDRRRSDLAGWLGRQGRRDAADRSGCGQDPLRRLRSKRQPLRRLPRAQTFLRQHVGARGPDDQASSSARPSLRPQVDDQCLLARLDDRIGPNGEPAPQSGRRATGIVVGRLTAESG